MSDIHLADHDASVPRASQETSACSAIDILYENQRGSFLCGIPFFSSASLLNFDPPPWVNQNYKPSVVNITNAQVPDPSWEWEWKSWYVDMSQDVDEEGWQYSGWLFKGFSWHGSHPWWHSFVRRRRWLRKRVKKRHLHKLEEDTEHGRKDTASIGTSVVPSTFRLSRQGPPPEEPMEEIKDIPALMRALKRATIDREKIVIIKQFIEQGGEELYYLAEKIPSIMSLLVFQNSRRQLLAALIEEIQAASEHRKEHVEQQKAEGEVEKRRIDNLLKARKIAEEECKKLEFWSDGKIAQAALASNGSARPHAHFDCSTKE